MFSTRAAARFLLLRFGAQPRRRPRQAAPLLGDISRLRHLPIATSPGGDISRWLRPRIKTNLSPLSFATGDRSTPSYASLRYS